MLILLGGMRLSRLAPVLGVCLAEVDRRRRDRQINEQPIGGVAKTVEVAVLEPATSPTAKGSVRSPSSNSVPRPSSATQICSELACRCGGLTAPGCRVTRVMVTRRDEEFSGNSSCSDCTPELDSVAIEALRMISIGAPQFCLLLYNLI